MKLAQTSLGPITGPSGVAPSSTGIQSLISTVIGFLTIVGGILFLIWFIVGAFNWITAEGKPEKLEKARNHITQALTGLLILVAAFAVTGVITSILGLDIFNLAAVIDKLTP